MNVAKGQVGIAWNDSFSEDVFGLLRLEELIFEKVLKSHDGFRKRFRGLKILMVSEEGSAFCS